MWLEGGGKDKQVNRLQRGMTSTTKTYMFLPSWGHGRLAALPQAPRSCIERHSDLWFMRGVNLSEWTTELSSSLYWLSILGRQIRKKKKKNSGSLGASREFLKFCKPFPLFPYHFTPPPIRHLLQIVGVKQYSKPEKKGGGGKSWQNQIFMPNSIFQKWLSLFLTPHFKSSFEASPHCSFPSTGVSGKLVPRTLWKGLESLLK